MAKKVTYCYIKVTLYIYEVGVRTCHHLTGPVTYMLFLADFGFYVLMQDVCEIPHLPENSIL